MAVKAIFTLRFRISEPPVKKIIMIIYFLILYIEYVHGLKSWIEGPRNLTLRLDLLI